MVYFNALLLDEFHSDDAVKRECRKVLSVMQQQQCWRNLNLDEITLEKAPLPLVQKDGWSCGLWAILCIHCIVLKVPLGCVIPEMDIAEFKYALAWNMIQSRILQEPNDVTQSEMDGLFIDCAEYVKSLPTQSNTSYEKNTVVDLNSPERSSVSKRHISADDDVARETPPAKRAKKPKPILQTAASYKSKRGQITAVNGGTPKRKKCESEVENLLETLDYGDNVKTEIKENIVNVLLEYVGISEGNRMDLVVWISFTTETLHELWDKWIEKNALSPWDEGIVKNTFVGHLNSDTQVLSKYYAMFTTNNSTSKYSWT
jgi:hypothetical protein